MKNQERKMDMNVGGQEAYLEKLRKMLGGSKMVDLAITIAECRAKMAQAFEELKERYKIGDLNTNG